MTPCIDPAGFGFESPHDAVQALVRRLEPVGSEQLLLGQASGRVLAQGVVADRDSPPADVSAMDGYAVRMADLEGLATQRLQVSATSAMGHVPPEMTPGTAVRVSTGAYIPAEAEAVIPRELLTEFGSTIAWPGQAPTVRHGQHIRRRGENRRAGEPVASPGYPIDAPMASALAGFGVVSPSIYRRVRVAVITTGDEVVAPDRSPEAAQIRNSNGPAINAYLSALPWIDLVTHLHARDTKEGMAEAMSRAIRIGDAVITAGGVSMGDHDYIPPTLAALGGETLYHKLPMRPGKPNLGALSACGKPILALPGNPVAVLVGLRIIVLPVLRRLGGFAVTRRPRAVVRLHQSDGKTLPLWWYRPVALVGDGEARLLPNLGSGDFASTAGMSGFIEVPPQGTGEGPWPLYDD